MLCAQYTVPKSASLDVMKYRDLLHELELVFTVPVRLLLSGPPAWLRLRLRLRLRLDAALAVRSCRGGRRARAAPAANELPSRVMPSHHDWLPAAPSTPLPQHLEKYPLAEVAPEPSELLDRQRYQRSARDLGPEREGQLAELVGELAEVGGPAEALCPAAGRGAGECRQRRPACHFHRPSSSTRATPLRLSVCPQACTKRGLLVKPFFDDAARDDHSTKLFGHVTCSQFRQCISVKLGLRVR